MTAHPIQIEAYDAPSLPERLAGLLMGMACIARVLAQRLARPGPDPRPIVRMDFIEFFRLQRAARWATALADVISGRTRLLPRPTPVLAPNPRPPRDRSAHPNPSTAFLDTSVRSMREAFRTRSIGEITARLCRELGNFPGTSSWPADLIALTQTPAEWSAEHFPLAVRTTQPETVPVPVHPASVATPPLLLSHQHAQTPARVRGQSP